MEFAHCSRKTTPFGCAQVPLQLIRMQERIPIMAKAKNIAQKVTITGFVEEFEYDDGAYGLKVVTDENEYIVELDKTGKRLRKLEGEEVEATGLVTYDKDGVNHLKMEHFEVIEYNDNDDSDDYGYYDDDDIDRDDYDRYDH